MRFPCVLATLPFTLCATFVWAEPATDAGAAALTAVLQTYLGASDGVVNVAVEGEVYGVTLDFAPLIAALPDAGTEALISPMQFQLADSGDGTWLMTQDQAFDLALKVPGQMDMTIKMGQWAGTGIFDENLQAFSTSSSKISELVATQTTIDPTLGETKVAYSIASISYESTAVAAVEGGVDSTSTYALSTLDEVFTMPGMGDGAAPMEMTLAAETYTADARIRGLRPDAFYKLIAFFVANPSEAAILAQQDGLKTILRDGVPLFDHLISTGTATAITVGSPMGTFGLNEAGVIVETRGLVADGLFREAFTLSGLTTPVGLVPDWATQLVPASLSLDFKLSGFDLLAPLTLALDTVDFATGPADQAAFEGQLAMALMPKGVVDITMAPGSIAAPIYTLGYEGSMSAGAAALPLGNAKITLKGMADVLAVLAAAPPEMAGQAAPMLTMAEGMAKPGPDGALVWELEVTPAGGMLVNGVDMMGAGAP